MKKMALLETMGDYEFAADVKGLSANMERTATALEALLGSRESEKNGPKLDFISINKDGERVEWHMTISEMYKRYQGNNNLGDGTLPALSDTILACVFAGVHLYFKTFSDMADTFYGRA